MIYKRILVGLAVLGAAAITAFVLPSTRLIQLPGTQPNVVQPFDPYNSGAMACQTCHQTLGSSRIVTITADWQGSMMSHAARDPLFYAATAVANKYIQGSGEFCIRCHSPAGWLEGRSVGGRGDSLRGNDLNGVQCDFCHRMKDPMILDTAIVPPVPGYGNGMYVVQPSKTTKRGPYFDAYPAHSVQGDAFYRSGNFCGVCHNVSNPLYASDPITQPPHAYSPIERTYSEWKLSWWSTQGSNGTCQSCHMPASTGYGCNLSAAPLRTDLAKHDLTGGNTFVPDILGDFWPGLDSSRIAAGKQRAMETLQRAASLDMEAVRRSDTVTASVRITNLTGHKLPTGYPEGRRMWLNVVGYDAAGDTIFESGGYDFATAELVHDAQVKIYETKPGLTAARAVQYGLQPGPSFYFVLNDTIYFDNRIPPLGFNNAAFASHLAQPVAYSYADGQHWDVTTYHLPAQVASVTATLYYQTSSKEYITFLRDENVGNAEDWNHWGDSLYAAWERRGKSRPVSMASVSVDVVDSTTAVHEGGNLPLTFSLKQNYPNPFNPATTIEFSISKASLVSLTIFDVLGREVATIVNRPLGSGNHRYIFDARDLPSGVYLYRLQVGGVTETRKLLLLK